jgi:tight adherence protein B
VVNLVPALACLALALAAAATPPAVGDARLTRLHRRVPVRRARRLPGVTAAGAGAVVGLLALGTAGAVVGAVAGALWHRRHVRQQASRTATATANQLADALGRITEELRAGALPAAALGGTDADGPLARVVLAPAATAAALGEGVPAALTTAADGHPAVAGDVRRVARAFALAERHGVPAADLLASVLGDIRWRAAFTGRIRAQLAGPRATAAVLAALPGLGIALGELVGAGPLAVLRSGVLGQLLVLVGAGLVAAGAAWTERILRTAVPR